jgi:hypothetical protein
MDARELELEVRSLFGEHNRIPHQVEIQETGGSQILTFVSYFTDGTEHECEVYTPESYTAGDIVEELELAIMGAEREATVVHLPSERFQSVWHDACELDSDQRERLIGQLIEQRDNEGLVDRMHELTRRLAKLRRLPNLDQYETVLRAITCARDYNATFGNYPDGWLGADQAFDDWASDLADTALGVA